MVENRPASSYGTQSSPRTNAAEPGIPRRTSLRVRTQRDRPLSAHTFLSSHSANSRPDTPIPGLETHEARAVRKNYETASKMVEITCRVVGKYNDVDADKEVVVAALKDILNEDVLASCRLPADFRVLPDRSPNLYSPTSKI
jgi:hypothetical protein